MFKSDFFDNFFDDDFFDNFFDWRLTKNVKKDSNGNTIIKVDVPGFNKDNINVEFENGVINVNGTSDERTISKKLRIGDVDSIDAELKDGILTITIKNKKKVNKIEVK